MESYSTALLLGIVQGFTEFLPISSTGHLIIFEEFLGLSAQHMLSFDVAVHVATALAVIWYFKKDWLMLIRSFAARTNGHGRKLLLNIVLGTIPAGILGILFEDAITSVFRSRMSVAIGLIAGSALIAGAEYIRHRRNRESETIQPYESFIIGFFQALALFPGISRSGSTISGGLLLGKTRVEATRFAFLLATPIIIGAALKTFVDQPVTALSGPLLFGFIAAFLAGIAAIKIISTIAQRSTLMPFVYYRLALAAILMLSLAL